MYWYMFFKTVQLHMYLVRESADVSGELRVGWKLTHVINEVFNDLEVTLQWGKIKAFEIHTHTHTHTLLYMNTHATGDRLIAG